MNGDPDDYTDRTKPYSSTRHHPWTIAHAFYGVMGGFAVDTPEPISVFGEETRFVLNPKGISYVMEHYPHLIPDISATSLKDRSKADGIAKALLVCQVLYFCASCVLRAVEVLPLSLLEITTLAHALCALLTYAVWWEKPLSIMEPTLLGTRHPRDIRCIVAKLLMATPTTTQLPGGAMIVTSPAEDEFLRLYAHPERREEIVDIAGDEGSLQVDMSQTLHLGDLYYKMRSQVADGYRWMSRINFGNPTQWPWYIVARHNPHSSKVNLSPKDFRRWKLAGESKGSSLPEDSYIQREAYISVESCLGSSFRLIVKLSVVGTLCTAVYGFPHVLGWNAQFSSDTLNVLWHVASVILLSLGVMAVAIFYASVFLAVSLGLNSAKTLQEQPNRSMFVIILGPFLLAAYIFASGFLIITSIQQLFILSPDSDVFHQSSISNFWPHIV